MILVGLIFGPFLLGLARFAYLEFKCGEGHDDHLPNSVYWAVDLLDIEVKLLAVWWLAHQMGVA